MNDNNNKKTCAGKNFNYCKVAKILVAIPAMPIIAYAGSLAISFAPLMGAALFVGIAIAYAIWIDSLPSMQRKLFPCQCAKSD